MPKLPSVLITDIADIVAPECKYEIIGMRPGEKLHETLVSNSESDHTVDCGDYYIICPQFHFWSVEYETGGVRVPSDFVYASDTNSHRIGVSELAKLVEH